MSIPSKAERFLLAAKLPLTLADCAAPDMPLLLANPAFALLTGYETAEVEGRNCRFLQGDLPQPEARAEIRAAIAERRELQIVLKNRRRTGEAFDNLLFLYPIGDRLVLGSQFALPRVQRIVSSVTQHQALAEIANRLAEEIAGQRLAITRNSSDAVAQTVRAWMTRRI